MKKKCIFANEMKWREQNDGVQDGSLSDKFLSTKRYAGIRPAHLALGFVEGGDGSVVASLMKRNDK